MSTAKFNKNSYNFPPDPPPAAPRPRGDSLVPSANNAEIFLQILTYTHPYPRASTIFFGVLPPGPLGTLP